MYNKADALKEVRFKLRTERQVAVRQAEKEGGGKKVLGVIVCGKAQEP